MRLKRVCCIFVFAILACACGQRGPLYLPEQATSNQSQNQDLLEANRTSPQSDASNDDSAEVSP
ncbi:LPS translocon maturation chaperone LptM [Agaribacter flavus]